MSNNRRRLSSLTVPLLIATIVILGVVSGIGIAAEGIAALHSGDRLPGIFFLVLGLGTAVTFGLLGAFFVVASLIGLDEARRAPRRISVVVGLIAPLTFVHLPMFLILLGTGPGGALVIWKGISLVGEGIVWQGVFLIVAGFIVVLVFLLLLTVLVWTSRPGLGTSKDEDVTERPGIS